jgi:D-serine deaminase-like pyridoxal phosphate-dependent protein
MRIEELDTPSVIIDLDILERNLARLGAYCREHGINLRPHTKTHKIPAIAKMQIGSGAIGITVAKVSEAEVMTEAGIQDVLVAYPIVSESKAAVLARLACRANITVSLDSIEAAQYLSQCASRKGSRIGILVEMDVGLHRCGVSTPGAAARLAGQIAALPAVELKGLMFYPGHMLADYDGQTRLIPAVNAKLEECYDLFHKAGLPATVVSGGSTPTAYRSHEFHGITEIRPGMYPFYDRNMLAIGACQLEDCAASVLVTVVSTAVEGMAIVDGGSKTFSSDRFLAGDGRGYGKILQDEAAEFAQMSEEHGHLDIRHSGRRYPIGERLNIIPNHVCATINMHDEIYGVRGGVVEETWNVAARGRVR